VSTSFLAAVPSAINNVLESLGALSRRVRRVICAARRTSAPRAVVNAAAVVGALSVVAPRSALLQAQVVQITGAQAPTVYWDEWACPDLMDA
jgi:hypothetical protein